MYFKRFKKLANISRMHLCSDAYFIELIGKVAVDACWEWLSTAYTNGNALTLRKLNTE